MIPLIELIPNAALAALLIYVGCQLASFTSFSNTYEIGGEQLVVFLATVIGTIAKDLLLVAG